MEKIKEYILIDGLYKLLINSLESNAPIAKRHKLNDWLGFGFKKDDLILEPFIDRWERYDSQTISRFHWWLNEKFLPFINHGCSIPIRMLNASEIRTLEESSVKILKNSQEGQYGYLTTVEIRAAVIATAAASSYSCRLSAGIGDNEYQQSQQNWYQLGYQIAEKLRSSAKPGSVELSSAMINLQAICEGNNA